MGPKTSRAGISLLFDAGQRPRAAEIAAAVKSAPAGLAPAQISHFPDSEEGWLELVASGLTFDLAGLAPAQGLAIEPADYRFGLGPGEGATWEAIELVPGPHIAGGRTMLPIVRVMTGLAALLAGGLPVVAVCWKPAQSWMAPDYFSRIVTAWLAGGPFPALGLTAFGVEADRSVRSAGLSFFSGQELLVPPKTDEAPVDTIKLAARLVDRLVENGPLEAACTIEAPGGENLVLEPSADGQLVIAGRGR